MFKKNVYALLFAIGISFFLLIPGRSKADYNHGDPSPSIHYQGRIRDVTTGELLNTPPTTIDVRFTLYNGASVIHTPEAITDLAVTNGVFETSIPIGDSIDFAATNADYTIGLEVKKSGDASYDDLGTQPLYFTPLALNAHMLDGFHAQDFLSGGADFIENNYATGTQQNASAFWISDNGRIGGNLLVDGGADIGANLVVGGNISATTGYAEIGGTCSSYITCDNDDLYVAGTLGAYDGGRIGRLAIGDISIPANRGDLTVESSAYARIYYDRDDTGYYVDPASTTILNTTYNYGPFYMGQDQADTDDMYIADRILDWDNNAFYLDLNTTSRLYRADLDDTRSNIFRDRNNIAYFWDGDNATTSMTVAGDVGIGTTTPAFKLDVAGAASFGSTVDGIQASVVDLNSDEHTIRSRGTDTDMTIKSIGTGTFYFGNANTLARMTSAGDLLPHLDNDDNLGALPFRWNTGFIRNLCLGDGSDCRDSWPTNYWSLTANALHPTDPINSVGIGTSTTPYKLTINGTIGTPNIDNPYLVLDSNSVGTSTLEQSAQISLGESGRGIAALHLAYTGDGYSYIGMGALGADNIPDNYAMRMFYTNRNVYFPGSIGVGTVTAPVQSIHTSGSIRTDARRLYLGAAQNLYGDGSSMLYYNSNNSTYATMVFRDAEGIQYGRVYGSNDGANFGLMDGDANWSYMAVKDNYTQFRINNDPKITILSSGNVGIGTQAPATRLHVQGTIRTTDVLNCAQALETNAAGDIVCGTDDTGLTGSGTPTYLPLWTGATALGDSVVYQDASNNIGIGTMTPTDKLSIIAGDVGIDTGYAYRFGYGRLEHIDSASIGANLVNLRGFNSMSMIIDSNNNSANAEFVIGTDGNTVDDLTYSELFRVQEDGNVGIGTNAPSRMLDVDGTVRFRGYDATCTKLYTDASGNVTCGTDQTGIQGSGVATRVAFWTAADSIGSNANLYWDNTNSRLGVGTTAPGTPLQVAGATRSDNFLVDRNAAVNDAALTINDVNRYIWTPAAGWGEYWDTSTNSIEWYGSSGTERMNFDLDNGNMQMDGDLTVSGGDIYLPTSRLSDSVSTAYLNMRPQNARLILYNGSSNYTFDVYNAGSRNVHLIGSGTSWINGGSVGIGTSSPSYKLHVATGHVGLDENYSLYVGASARFYSDASYMRYMGPRPFYVVDAVPATYLYSATTFLGSTSGDTIRVRGNVMYGDAWYMESNGLRLGAAASPGTWELYVTGQTYVSDYLRADGGIHVGGSADPGTDNLIVDGHATFSNLADAGWGDLRIRGRVIDTLNSNMHFRVPATQGWYWSDSGGFEYDMRLLESTGNLYIDGSYYCGNAADIAEYTQQSLNQTRMLEAGDVVVIDPTEDETIRLADQPYDTSVAGIVSTNPGFVLAGPGADTDENTVAFEQNGQHIQLALAGRVPTKVTDENGPIQRGDLLVSSSKPGYAMKANPDQLSFGMILGKAMGELPEGEGKITVLINLQ